MPIPLCPLCALPNAAVRCTVLERCSHGICVLFTSFFPPCLRHKSCACLCKGSADLAVSCLRSPFSLCSAGLLFVALLKQPHKAPSHCHLCRLLPIGRQSPSSHVLSAGFPDLCLKISSLSSHSKSCNVSPNTQRQAHRSALRKSPAALQVNGTHGHASGYV